MSGTLRVVATIRTTDPSRTANERVIVAKDDEASEHDLIDETYRKVATAGDVGAAFVDVPSPVAQFERLVAHLPAETDLVIRLGGTPATVLGSVSGAVAPAGGETVQLDVDGGGTVTAILDAADTSIALVAKRINFAADAKVATVDGTTGGLRLTGTKTGDAGAAARGHSHGVINVVGGTGLALVGLTAGKTYGAGRDSHVGPGLVALPFPASDLPKRVEVSGSSLDALFLFAGKAA